MLTNLDPNRSQIHLPIGAQRVSSTLTRIRSSPTVLRDQNELTWRAQNGLAWCDSFSFLIVNSLTRGSPLSCQASSIWFRFWLPGEGSGRAPVSRKGSSSRTRWEPCLPLPLREAPHETPISGPTASLCLLPPNQDQIVGVLGWKGNGRKQT